MKTQIELTQNFNKYKDEMGSVGGYICDMVWLLVIGY